MQRPLMCLMPIVGIFIGLVIGVLAAEYLPTKWAEDSLAAKAYPRALGVVASLFWWSVLTVGRGKKLHCGGTLPFDRVDLPRYLLLMAVGIVVWFLIYAAYFSADAMQFIVLMVVFIGLLFSEIGWGHALYHVPGFRRYFL